MLSPARNESASRTIAEYAAQIASASPTPGGGSVAATVGSLACALAEMVCNVTLSGNSRPSEPDTLQEAAAAGCRLRGKLLELATADETAYAGYQRAAALPRSTEIEKLARRRALDLALTESTSVPLEIARAGLDVLDQLMIAAEHGTKHALSDVSTGAVLAEAAIRSALFTVRVNVGLTKDIGARDRYLSEIDSLHARMTQATHGVLAAVERRSLAV